MSEQIRTDQISPLRRRMIEEMTVRNLSPTTQQSCNERLVQLSAYPTGRLIRSSLASLNKA